MKDPNMSNLQFDWGTYYQSAEASLKKRIESEPETWKMFTNSDKRYMLVSNIKIVQNNIDGSMSGIVTGCLDFHISSNDIEDLRLLWKSKFVQQRYSTTAQHFIVDTKEIKVVEFLSVCM